MLKIFNKHYVNIKCLFTTYEKKTPKNSFSPLEKKNAFAKIFLLNIFIACLYGKILWKNIFPRKNSFFMIYS